jgi:hypothetical protein
MLARCRLARLGEGAAADVASGVAALEGRLDAEERRELSWELWRATGDRAHLAQAKRLLDESVASVPAEHRESMVANVRLNREIAAAD